MNYCPHTKNKGKSGLTVFNWNEARTNFDESVMPVRATMSLDKGLNRLLGGEWIPVIVHGRGKPREWFAVKHEWIDGIEMPRGLSAKKSEA